MNVCRRHSAAIENTASNGGDWSGKLNLIQLSRSVAVIVCDTLGACLRTIWENSLHSTVGPCLRYMWTRLKFPRSFNAVQSVHCLSSDLLYFCLTEHSYKRRSLDEPLLHTPFCGKGCVFEHHDILVKILNCTNHRSDDQNHAVDCAFAVREYAKLMGPSTNLPDPLFPCPIVHIVAMLGKIRVLDKLGQMPEFDFGCRMEPTGETALHKMIQYLDKAMKEPTRRCCLVKIKETFQVALGRLINKKPELFVLQDHQGDTPFHSTVRAMLSWKSSNWTGKRLEYFAFCLQSMISTLKSLDSGHFLSCTTKDVLSITNKRGDNFLQMLDTMGLDNSIIGSVYSQLDPCLLKELRQGFVSREIGRASCRERV